MGTKRTAKDRVVGQKVQRKEALYHPVLKIINGRFQMVNVPLQYYEEAREKLFAPNHEELRQFAPPTEKPQQHWQKSQIQRLKQSSVEPAADHKRILVDFSFESSDYSKSSEQSGNFS